MRRILFLLLLAGCSSKPEPVAVVAPAETPKVTPAAIAVKNITFTPATVASRLPRVRSIELPAIPGAAAIWGATGRDHNGQIYIGVSIDGVATPSAHLLSLNPANDTITDLGGALEQLTRLNLAKPGEGQNKIHTKILQAADGKLYFASMDETGESEDGSKLPTFGSHLWRLTPGQSEWEHLGECREAILACAVGGKFVYYLGYFGHVLYQFDTTTGKIANSVGVGAIGGHTTRNFLADDRGHAYVPRVSAEKAELVEYDEELREVAKFPLHGYSRMPDPSSHGIVGVAALEDGGWLFTTDRGRLYRLDPRATGSSLTDLGWLHPDGECYAACLFCLDGQSRVVALGNIAVRGEPVFEWIAYDLKTKRSTSTPLKLPTKDGRNLLAYGSFTRDDAGRCYVGGRYVKNEGDKTLSVPVLWSVEP